jgi:hypothetical protein
MASNSPVHKLFAFSPWLSICSGVTLSLSPCASTGQISYVLSGWASFSFSSTHRACTCASAERRVPIFMVGNCVLADVFEVSEADWEGAGRPVAVAEAIGRIV